MRASFPITPPKPPLICLLQPRFRLVNHARGAHLLLSLAEGETRPKTLHLQNYSHRWTTIPIIPASLHRRGNIPSLTTRKNGRKKGRKEEINKERKEGRKEGRDAHGGRGT
ncbi:hypothetical protein E2C01_034370 [Portunus trituberculatus]|uniref:Uncharacterized protein n=1 Tax=Portunus trituberculatus TaxID=210409 RepID=A0A5B7F1F5_PORTR|nr:hypothetical protein [Portunus trituberculatus]